MDYEHITLNSFNCRGIRNSQKRKNIFNWLKNQHFGLTMLQETHSDESDESLWENEWGGKMYFSHGTSNIRGVAILIPDKLASTISVKNIIKDNYSRLILMECEIQNTSCIIVTVYFPTKDKPNEQVMLLEYIRQLLMNYSGHNIIIGGDFNTCLNFNIDKKVPQKKVDPNIIKNLIIL